MKILILSDANSIHTIRWAESLIAKNIDIQIFSFFKPKKSNTVKLKKLNIKVITPDLRKKIKNLREPNISKIKYLQSILLLKKSIKAFQPDILHAHYASSYGLLGMICKFRPYVLSVWGSDIYDFPSRNIINNILLKFVIKSATKICSTSIAMKKIIEKKYNRLDVQVVPFGIDLKYFDYNKKKNKNFTVGIIKSIESYNGIDILIDSANILVNQLNEKIAFIIVGKGSIKKEMEQKVRILKLENSVKFFGFIPHNRIKTYFNKINVFIAPSNREGFGVSVLEAAATGVPAITSNVGGLQEVNVHNKTGLILEKNSPDILAKNILRLFKNKNLAERLGKNGRAHVEEKFNWIDNLNKMIDIYHKLLAT